jgi:Protein of unknown function (DUF2752)
MRPSAPPARLLMPMTRSFARTGSPRAAGMAVAALAAGAIAAARLETDLAGGEGMPCPFREVTGLPCPLCGSTRALAHLGELDPVFLRYNAVVALAVAVALAAGVLVAVRPAAASRLSRLGAARRPLRTGLLLVLAAWVVALLNHATIVA